MSFSYHSAAITYFLYDIFSSSLQTEKGIALPNDTPDSCAISKQKDSGDESNRAPASMDCTSVLQRDVSAVTTSKGEHCSLQS